MSAPPPALEADAGAADVQLLVARQPIFDAAGDRAGYELLYRPDLNATAAGTTVDPEHMSADVVANALAGLGVEALSEGVPAWLNFPRGMLVSGGWRLFDPRAVVIEVLETVEADREVLAALTAARQHGYRVALDDFVHAPERAALVAAADVLKVDVLGRTADELAEVRAALAPFGRTLVAERVEDEAMRGACAALGFELFQGYFFARPETLSRREVPVQQASLIHLLNLLADETVTDPAVEEAFGGDPSLSFKLLRLVNSAQFGGRDIHSIRHAVQLAGRENLSRWLGVLFVSSLARRGGGGGELVHTAVQRAHLLGALGSLSGRAGDAGELFMVGLFSTLEPLLGMPFGELLRAINVAPGVRDALLGRRGEYAAYLALAEAFERGEWDAVRDGALALDIDTVALAQLYRRSLAMASEHLRLARY
jgi:EAL and modified HD-GYP domain-containing signal transduction protein